MATVMGKTRAPTKRSCSFICRYDYVHDLEREEHHGLYDLEMESPVSL
jgi:hypothetical protein